MRSILCMPCCGLPSRSVRVPKFIPWPELDRSGVVIHSVSAEISSAAWDHSVKVWDAMRGVRGSAVL